MPDFGRMLRRLRQERGWTQTELARRVHVGQSALSRYESGRSQPSPDVVEALAEVLGDALRTAAPAMALNQVDGGAGDALAAIELARRVEASDVGDSTLQQLEEGFDQMAIAYSSAAPSLLLPQVTSHLGYVSELLDGPKLSLSAHRRLVVAGAWYSLLAATIHIDLNQHDAATARLRAAASLARHAGHDEIRAWAAETEAWRQLTAGQLRRAYDLTKAARYLAPVGSSIHVQATAQQGRVLARLGDSESTYHAVDSVNSLAADLPTLDADEREHHYRYDGTKRRAYTATTLSWLGDPAAAGHAEHVIDQLTPKAGESGRWPRRLASAYLDLALVQVKTGEVDSAADSALTAMRTGSVVPSNFWRAAEVVRAAEARRMPQARELQAAYRLMTQS
ncbi:XRE family transcriptional regulator [Actinoalloteichus sp. AHMU CJ021]|uniref:Helix-turn-helix domain-containing protein n=2 Tax=Pseudonocardiaceae TaxID=2070 RepID=A0ABT1JHV7_ACTCY|nr:XRE family transcriptional regulator [Actinoalloteichus sp. AHMU CJ021]MCP2332094.1 Helix-turn-helix domain-containing protein [Actinoalloteichus caeruleus DSM 43889]